MLISQCPQPDVMVHGNQSRVRMQTMLGVLFRVGSKPMHARRKRCPTARRAPGGSTGSLTTGIPTQRHADHVAVRLMPLQPCLWATLLRVLLLRFSQESLRHLPWKRRASQLSSPSRTQASRATRLRTWRRMDLKPSRAGFRRWFGLTSTAS